MSRDSSLERLEAAAQGARCAMVCAHQSADEFHRALIDDYLRGHAPKQIMGFIVGIALFAAFVIWF
jgi:hypothetical protein